MSIIAVDVGGTSIKVGLVEQGRLLGRRSMAAAPERGLGVHLPELAKLIQALCAEHGLQPQTCDGLGMAFPALVDGQANRVVSPPADKYTDAGDIDLNTWTRHTFGLPFKLEVDGHAALLGEWRYGAGRGSDDLVMVALGMGYGSSVIIRGRPLRGKHHQAGALGGHFIVNAGGRQCICPGRGCIEAEIGTWALPAIIREQPDYVDSILAQEAILDYRALFEAAAKDDPLAVRLRQRNLELLGYSIVSLIHAYDPERVIMGGGIMQSAEVILPTVREVVRQNVWTSWGYPDIVLAAHPDTAALLGVGVLFEGEIEML